MLARGTGVAPSGFVTLDAHARSEIVSRLENGEAVDDAVFDAIYPHSLRVKSSCFWTPVAVALRAAEMLAPRPDTRVLDVGAGVGKLCIVGAARTRALFVGIEQREHLVRAAASAARALGTTNARFFHGSFEQIDIETFDAIYFFNPFEENLWPAEDQLDHTVELSEKRFVRDLLGVAKMLAQARPGTRVVTYHGLGADLPPEFAHVHRKPISSGALDVFIKKARAA
jgi:16S rRNA G966 N2-methylase RsmD